MKRKICVVLAVFLCIVAMCILLAACNDSAQNNTGQTSEGDLPSETPVEPDKNDPENSDPSRPKTYSVTFVADGNVVSVVSYSENTATISEPSVPNKTGYTGAWEPYSLGAANIIVNAVYTPIKYTVTFVADGATVGTAVYTVENRDIAEPLVPEKTGYSAEWENYTLTIVYTVIFVADNETVAERRYTVEDNTFAVPSVPNKVGYTGVWETYSLKTGDMTVNAVYTPIEYTVTFVADGATAGTAVYTVENRDIAEPLVPEKTGYSAEWENYTLTVTFAADGEFIAERTYTIEHTEVAAPPVPSKEHYTAAWEEYFLTTGDLTVNAVYTPIEYMITFVADGKTVGKVGYTIEDNAVAEPQVPHKENCIGTWEDYTLTGRDFTVNAVYVTAMEFALTTDSSFYVVLRYAGNEEEVEVPAMYNGLRVVAIAEDAFAGNTATRKITLPNSIEQIQSGAFGGCTSLANINIPANVQLIGDDAFSGCTSLRTLSMGQSVATIGANAFAHCTALRSITLNEGLTTIGSFAFDGCTALTDITLPDSLEELGTGVFRHAESLETINFPTLIIAIPNVTFQYCLSLKSVVIPATVSEIGHSAFSYCYGLDSLRIEGDITTIGDSVFFNCYNLTSIYYNSSIGGDVGDENYIFYNAGSSTEGVTLTLGTNAVIPNKLFDPVFDENKPLITAVAFEDGQTAITSIYSDGLPYLESITIPDSVTTIEPDAFTGCEGALYNEYGITYADGWAIFCDKEATTITIRDGIRGIASGVFDSCTDASSLTIPENFSNLTAEDFVSLKNLTHAAFPITAIALIPKNKLQNAVITSGTNIENSAFSGCTSLTSVTIPDSVTSIGYEAFRSCSSLTSVTIPDNVINIGIGAFNGCSSLESMTIAFVGNKANKTSSDTYQYPFGYIFGTSSYTGGTAVEQRYYGSSTSSTTYDTYYIPSSLRSVTVTGGNILYGAFYNCSMLTSVTIPDSVTSIASCAFEACSNLTSITIPDSVTSIGWSAFSGCTGLTEIYYTGDVASWCGISGLGDIMSSGRMLYIGGEEVEGDLVIPDGVTSIGSYAFYNCSGLTSITIPDSVTSIGNYAFEGCSGLTSITIPDSVTSIGRYAFYGCSGLTSITIPDSVTSIGSSAFSDCSGLTSITIPDSVTSIGSSAFSDCSGLTSITIPDSVTSIGDRVFYGCSGLTSVTIGDSVTSIGESAFYHCNSLTSIVIPDSVTSIGEDAFSGCTSLTSVTIGDSVTSIGSNAFTGTAWYNSQPNGVVYAGKVAYKYKGTMPSSTSIVLREDTIAIEDYAFSGCTGLTSITIPDSVTSIGSYAFEDCSRLVEINWNAVSVSDFSSVSNVFYNAGTAGDGITVTFGDSVEKIPAYAFYVSNSSYRPNIKSVTIGNGVTSIEGYAFAWCTSLTSVAIPDSVTSIERYAFRSCSSLTSVTFEYTSNWYVTSDSTATSGTSLSSSNLVNPSTAATWLRSTYVEYYWKRK